MTAVYVMKDPAGPVKVGYSKDPALRIKSVFGWSGNRPEGYAVVSCGEADLRALEKRAHEILEPMHYRGEWFNTDPESAVSAVLRAAADLGLQVVRGAFPTVQTTPQPNRISVMLPDSLIAKIDQWRGRQPGVPSRSKAIRLMVDHAYSRLEVPENDKG